MTRPASSFKLLHLDSGIQGENSVSRILSSAVVDRLRAASPQMSYSYRDLVADPLPHLTLDQFTTPEAQQVLEEFLEADLVVIGVSMYNFGIPSQLKAWIDRIAIAERTFRYTATGPEGLAGAKQVYVALARGGYYSDGPAAPLEHAETYLRGVLAFMGITNPEFVIAEGQAMGPEVRESVIAAALSAAGSVSPPAHI